MTPTDHLFPCPGCGQNAVADRGHHICRKCEYGTQAEACRTRACRPIGEAVTDPNPKLERLIDQATEPELRRLLRELIAREPHLIYSVIGALEKRDEGESPFEPFETEPLRRDER